MTYDRTLFQIRERSFLEMNPNPYPPRDDEDLGNPYAPPRSRSLPEAAPPRFAGISFTVEDVFNWSWAIFNSRSLPCISLFWGMVGLNTAFALGTQLLLERVLAAGPEPAVVFFTFVIVALARLFVQVWLGIGMSRGLISVARHEPVSFDVIFSGRGRVATMMLAGIIVFVIIGAPILLLSLVIVATYLSMARVEPLSVLLVFVFGGGSGAAWIIYMAARLMQFYFLVIDREVDVFQSIQWSWRLTRDRASTIILVSMLQFCVGLAGFLACCVGCIVALPLSSMMGVVTYLALVEPAKTTDTTPPVTWEEEL
jgi:hypothetical protein